MRRFALIASRLTVLVSVSLVPGLLFANCASNKTDRLPCVAGPDANAANSVSCVKVLVPEAGAGPSDGKSPSDEDVDAKRDVADGVDSEPDARSVDVAPDIEVEPPNLDAASLVLPCSALPRACDPVDDVLCPSPSLTCYLTEAATTVCSCAAGHGDEGAPCQTYSDCMPGLACVGDRGDAATRRCRVACYVANPSCPTIGTSCLPMLSGAQLGYCG